MQCWVVETNSLQLYKTHLEDAYICSKIPCAYSIFFLPVSQDLITWKASGLKFYKRTIILLQTYSEPITVEPIFKNTSNSDNHFYNDRSENPRFFLYLSHSIYFCSNKYRYSFSSVITPTRSEGIKERKH